MKMRCGFSCKVCLNIFTFNLYLYVNETASVYKLEILCTQNDSLCILLQMCFMQLFLIDMILVSLVVSVLEKVRTCTLTSCASFKHWV